MEGGEGGEGGWHNGKRTGARRGYQRGVEGANRGSSDGCRMVHHQGPHEELQVAPHNNRPTSSAPVEGVPPCRWQTSFTPRLQSRAARQSLRLSQSQPMTGTPRAPHRPPSAMARAVVGGRALVGEPRGAGRQPLST